MPWSKKTSFTFKELWGWKGPYQCMRWFLLVMTMHRCSTFEGTELCLLTKPEDGSLDLGLDQVERAANGANVLAGHTEKAQRRLRQAVRSRDGAGKDLGWESLPGRHILAGAHSRTVTMVFCRLSILLMSTIKWYCGGYKKAGEVLFPNFINVHGNNKKETLVR